ncbi:MAG: HAMP domain-containing protein, partial [Bifidobacteriaceae bacterium]|nr:HAMP domain-containing protein [Bifidobacteriaceae bacterium]
MGRGLALGLSHDPDSAKLTIMNRDQVGDAHGRHGSAALPPRAPSDAPARSPRAPSDDAARSPQPPGFRLRLAAVIGLLTALGLAAAGSMAYLFELRRLDTRIAESLGRAVFEFENYVASHSSSEVESLISGAVAQSVNAADECTLGFAKAYQLAGLESSTQTPESAPPVTWTHQGGPQMCRRVLADNELTAGLVDDRWAQSVKVEHTETAAGGYAHIAVPVLEAGKAYAESLYAVVIDRAGQRAEVARSYTWGYLPLAVLTVIATTAAGWVAAGLVLRPLRLLAAATRDIARGPGGAPDISRRLAADGPAEAQALARAMNSLLDDLQQAW